VALWADPRRDSRRRPPGRPRQLASPPPESWPGTTPQWPSVGFGSAALRAFKGRGVPSCLPSSIYIHCSHPAFTGSMSAFRTIFLFVLGEYLVSCANTMSDVSSSSKLCPKLCGDFSTLLCSTFTSGGTRLDETDGEAKIVGFQGFFSPPSTTCARWGCA